MRPDLVSLEQPIARADRRFADSPGQVQAIVIRALTELYREHPPPAAFRAIVSPLVTWIWIGGAIAVLGRAARRLAVARGAPAPRALALRGPARPRAVARLRWSTPLRARLIAGGLGRRRRARPPLRRPGVEERREHGRIEELQAAKEAKYREIRDAELDREMGKLSRDDWRAVDRDLRGEAIEILRELDRLEGRRPGKALDAGEGA